MDQVNQVNEGVINGNRNRFFLFEVILSSLTPKSKNSQNPPIRRVKTVFKVPYERMSQEMQRIAKSGGTIVSIIPLTQVAYQSFSTSSFPWWVKITTQTPHCLYYFGPFDSQQEAIIHQAGYIEDLDGEGASEISLEILQAEPEILTQEWD